VVVREK
jgi:hypothetical protein